VSAYDSWFAPVPRSTGLSAATALVIVTEPRASVATTLILQEMGYTVDFGSEPAYALRWLRRARYDVVMLGGPEVATPAFAERLRRAAPDSRIILLAESPLPEGALDRLRVEVLPPPVDVNTLVRQLVHPSI
jgi:DNA-binding NtrC family response regulator